MSNDSTLGEISEPTPQNNPNLDELTRLVLRVIKLETDLEENKKLLDSSAEAGGKEMALLDQRIGILEEARKRQIELNATFAKTEKPVEKRFKFW